MNLLKSKQLIVGLFSLVFLLLSSTGCDTNRAEALSNKPDRLVLIGRNGKVKPIERHDKITFVNEDLIRYFFSTDPYKRDTSYYYEFPWNDITSHSYSTDSSNVIHMLLLDTAEFRINNKYYGVKKYLLNAESSIDEESILYFNEIFGVLKHSSVSWRNEIHQINNKGEDALVIYGLQQMINRHFKPGIDGYKPPPPPPDYENE